MLISPAQDLPLPNDMQKALKDARNSVTLSEAEHRRLVELRVAEETTIVELGKRKLYEEERLNDILAQVANSQVKLTQLRSEEVAITKDIDDRKAQIKLDEESIETRKEALQRAEFALESRQEILTEQEEECYTERESLADRELIIREKEEKFKNFIKSL